MSTAALELRIVTPNDPDVVEVRAVVDGQDIIDQIASDCRGEEPATLLTSGRLSATADAREVRLAEAECTEGCCGALYVTIRLEGDEVVWDHWRNPDDPELTLGEVRFDAAAYAAEIQRAAGDITWEWAAATVARLLGAELRGHDDWLVRHDCRLNGVRGARDGTVSLLFIHPRSLVNEQEQGRVDAQWLQYLVEYRVTDRDPAYQTKAIAGLLLNSDPRRIGRIVGSSGNFVDALGDELQG